MATIPELKAQADALNLTYPSKIRKAELEALIANAPQPVVQVSEVSPVLTKRERAALAGAMSASPTPLDNLSRERHYLAQRNAPSADNIHLLTNRQSRRIRKAENRADARNNRACASMGC